MRWGFALKWPTSYCFKGFWAVKKVLEEYGDVYWELFLVIILIHLLMYDLEYWFLRNVQKQSSVFFCIYLASSLVLVFVFAACSKQRAKWRHQAVFPRSPTSYFSSGEELWRGQMLTLPAIRQARPGGDGCFASILQREGGRTEGRAPLAGLLTSQCVRDTHLQDNVTER